MNGSRSVPGPSPTRPTAAQRPVSKTESLNPREFQINQLRRRFRPEEKEDASGSLLTFGIAPSDPDFPFELEFLQCILHIPFSYPGDGRPTLKVTNPEMERSFQANVERGFDNIVDASLRFGGRGTLLGWMNSLDKQLERLLTTTERGPTLKFVANVPSKDTSQTVQKQLAQPQATERDIPEHRLSSNPQATPVYTAEEKAQAKKRRTTEMKQIEARLSRVPLFQKRPDEDSFVIPIQPTKPDRLPVPLRSIKKVKLLVPSLYPLEPSSIELQGIASDDARPVEMGFAQWIKENSNLNLMSQINYLASNIHNFAKTPIEEPKDLPQNAQADKNVSEELLPATKEPVAESEDRPHIHYVPRPPEWTVGNTASGSEDDDTDESDSEDFSEEDDEDGGAPVPGLPESNRERGVALSFPTLEFYGIELLELMSLSITIRCERCKEHMDVKNVPHVTDKSDGFSPRVETCKKCANSMSIGIIHPQLLLILPAAKY
ncbi:hypothetical protein PHISCL_08895 [Aspergillus sclerotialis]|uniref:Uncharacterized protein n=1 Tax=Aspergillus sclerotialis TaxID=2070753 RepID=A0A3A2ZLK4_9EURO|nr:hypothetical protein PHISCL_08895 [Aspergillus sclerotialis]